VRTCSWLSWALAVFSLMGACSGESSDGSAICRSRCESSCHAVVECGHAEPSDGCVDECASHLEGLDCSRIESLDRLTCQELRRELACTDYCVTFCQRIPECGSFDSRLCFAGCMDLGPTICNAASVDARTCDDLKPEARTFEHAAQASEEGAAFGSVISSPSVYGLCTSFDDCEAPLGCSEATNTCAPCVGDSECNFAFSSQRRHCVEGACIADP
jgi:hypothetical protein